ncbi:hypothetical protein DPEC_G00114980 [Dallia pectoralis]|uniref:Uncharacterized protein n=1 Tax=Dallia pectoralis TaxID=75939 RepID=A0ACC2GUI0_DALPE|nr:hypothetical protein DPEC_G00114980 [Dallia pectoralis]
MPLFVAVCNPTYPVGGQLIQLAGEVNMQKEQRALFMAPTASPLTVLCEMNSDLCMADRDKICLSGSCGLMQKQSIAP